MEEEDKSHYEYISATCTEKAIHETFGGWVLDPPVEDFDLKCVSSGVCKIERGIAPIPVEDGDKNVLFARFTSFLYEPLSKFGPVEIGGTMFAYCKSPGTIFLSRPLSHDVPFLNHFQYLW